MPDSSRHSTVVFICTNHDVTSAQSHAGNDTFAQLHHVHALLQANQGYQPHSSQRGGCDDWLLGSVGHSSSLTPKLPLGESAAARVTSLFPLLELYVHRHPGGTKAASNTMSNTLTSALCFHFGFAHRKMD